LAASAADPEEIGAAKRCQVRRSAGAARQRRAERRSEFAQNGGLQQKLLQFRRLALEHLVRQIDIFIGEIFDK
jgi:hypothetical protein